MRNNILFLISLVGCVLMILGFIILGERGLFLLTLGLGMFAFSIYANLFDWFIPTYQESDILDDDMLATIAWQDELMEQNRIWNEEVTNSILEQNS